MGNVSQTSVTRWIGPKHLALAFQNAQTKSLSSRLITVDMLSRHVAVVHGIPPLAAKDAIIEAFAACGKILVSLGFLNLRPGFKFLGFASDFAMNLIRGLLRAEGLSVWRLPFGV